ncbi:MAG: hypothetical protein HY822_21305, partial [Acidobacteria bacterium]|nr:hypothetical protein [Acidobacteriota bacterium]
MIHRLDPSAERFLAGMAAVNRRLESAQRRVSTGKRILSASDAPDQVGPLLQTRTELSQAGQLRLNLSRIQGEVNTAEQALQSSVALAERALVLGAQADTDFTTPEARANLASEVKGLLDQMVGLSRTQVEGRYIFSGDADQAPPYTLDWAADPPLSAYQGAASTRQAMHPSGVPFAIAHSADRIFDNPDAAKNAFAALNGMRAALLANDRSAIQAALGRLKSADLHLNTELGFYGSVQNQVAQAMDAT